MSGSVEKSKSPPFVNIVLNTILNFQCAHVVFLGEVIMFIQSYMNITNNETMHCI